MSSINQMKIMTRIFYVMKNNSTFCLNHDFKFCRYLQKTRKFIYDFTNYDVLLILWWKEQTTLQDTDDIMCEVSKAESSVAKVCDSLCYICRKGITWLAKIANYYFPV